MKIILLVIQIGIAIGLMSAILVQSSKGGLGTAFGGGGEFRSKRGAEVVLFRLTIVLAAIFLIVSIVNLIIR